MTLVYAKIIGMFVCGAEPGGKRWGVGAGGAGRGLMGGGMKSLQKSIAHICSSLGRAGRLQACPKSTVNDISLCKNYWYVCVWGRPRPWGREWRVGAEPGGV